MGSPGYSTCPPQTWIQRRFTMFRTRYKSPKVETSLSAMELVHFISPKRKGDLGNQPATCHSSSRKNPSIIDYFTSCMLKCWKRNHVSSPFYFTKHSRNLKYSISGQQRPQRTSTHQCTIHWMMPVTTQLWMILN